MSLKAVKFFTEHEKDNAIVDIMELYADKGAVEFAEWLNGKDEEFYLANQEKSFSELLEIKKSEDGSN